MKNCSMGFDPITALASFVPMVGNQVQKWVNGGVPGMMREIEKISSGNIFSAKPAGAKPILDFNNPAVVIGTAGIGIVALLLITRRR